MSLKLDWGNSKLSKNLYKMENKVGAALLMYMSTKASEVESYMKRNRPWTDRTGMAKATLNTSVSQPSKTVLRMTLAHGVDYGIWLELAHEKNYAIIEPTIKLKGPEVVRDIGNLMAKIIV